MLHIFTLVLLIQDFTQSPQLTKVSSTFLDPKKNTVTRNPVVVKKEIGFYISIFGKWRLIIQKINYSMVLDFMSS